MKDFKLSRLNLCSYTESEGTDIIKDGQCDSECWRNFFRWSPYKDSSPCLGDRGAALMVREQNR